MVWLLDMSVLQQYFVRLLSHTVHWAIHRRDLEHLIRHLKNGNYKFKHIPWNESYIPPPITAKTLEDDKPFLAVYNFGTKEMDSTLVSLLEKMNLQTNIDLLAGGAPRNPRGNVQVSHGFTPVGHTRRQEHVATATATATATTIKVASTTTMAAKAAAMMNATTTTG